jgi:cystathionine beta-lyase
LSHKEINDLLLKKGKVALTDGLFFGKNGDKFFRLNVALPKSRLQEGLSKLVKSFE